jgi:subtilisin family serine protease
MPDRLSRIYSNDYADFILTYSGDVDTINQYEKDAVSVINYFFAVVHLPVREMTEDVISKMGYAPIPSVFGLISELSLESSGILRLRNIPNFDLRGKGVLIAIVDSGIDYTNPVFQYEDKTTKIAAIWDQTIINEKVQEGIMYGTEYSREQINGALKTNKPLEIVPTKDEIGHGTMVAGIAVGNEVPASGFYGVAPDAELLIVKLKPAKPYLKQFFRIPQSAVAYQESDLIFGIQYVLNYAAKVNKPVVLCMACDTSQYAHDGRGTTSSWLSLKSSMPGIGVVMAVGNEGNARRHYLGRITEAEKPDMVELNVGANEEGFSMELWGISPNTFSVDITTPSGEYISRIDIRLNETREITFIFEPTIIYIDYQMVESQSGDQLILFRFSKPSQGIWKFNVYGRGLFPMTFDMWLPMNNFIGPDTFFARSDASTSLLSLSCAISPISVTAYNIADESLFLDAGRGYSRIQIVKPDIAAPGVNIVAPTVTGGFAEVTGTSLAVAHTAGVAAMLMEWGIVKGNYPKMSTQDMKTFMIRGARRKADTTYPNRDWGYGILDIFRVFDEIRNEIK